MSCIIGTFCAPQSHECLVWACNIVEIIENFEKRRTPVKASRRIALSIALSLLAPGLALALANAETQPSAFSPVYVSQSLPPIQGGGYQSPGYSNTGNGSYTTYPQYGQQQPTYSQPSYSQPSYSQPSYSQPTYSQPGYSQQAPLQGYVVTAPPGTIMSATFTSPVSSEFARVGDRFTATLGSPVAAGTSVILPAGSQMEGQVVMVKAAGRTGRNGELDIRFTSAILPNGQRVPLSAKIQTEDGTGIIKGGTTAGRVGRAAVTTGVGAGLGAALGTAMGPLSGGKVGKGAIYGTILGAGMGALGSAWQKGKPAVVESGQPINIVLDQPLTSSPSVSGQSQYGPAPDQNYQYYQPQQNQQPYNYYGGPQ
jgi:hypothetical protein